MKMTERGLITPRKKTKVTGPSQITREAGEGGNERRLFFSVPSSRYNVDNTFYLLYSTSPYLPVIVVLPDAPSIPSVSLPEHQPLSKHR